LKGKLMNRSKILLAACAMLTAALVVGTAPSASASPVGTSFGFAATNFPGDSPGELIPFGVPTLSVSGMVIDSHATPVPGGDEFLDFWFNTNDGGYLANSLLAESQFLIQGINWGPGAPPAVGVGLLYISFDVDGVFEELAFPNGLGLPILPHPITGQDSIVLDVDGDPADAVPFAVGISLGQILSGTLAGEPTTIDIVAVNSMHIGFQIHHIPEPTSMMLVISGLVGLCLVRRRSVR
jgi:hypothetical protein